MRVAEETEGIYSFRTDMASKSRRIAQWLDFRDEEERVAKRGAGGAAT